jgi:hypothetical protein
VVKVPDSSDWSSSEVASVVLVESSVSTSVESGASDASSDPAPPFTFAGVVTGVNNTVVVVDPAVVDVVVVVVVVVVVGATVVVVAVASVADEIAA